MRDAESAEHNAVDSLILQLEEAVDREKQTPIPFDYFRVRGVTFEVEPSHRRRTNMSPEPTPEERAVECERRIVAAQIPFHRTDLFRPIIAAEIRAAVEAEVAHWKDQYERCHNALVQWEDQSRRQEKEIQEFRRRFVAAQDAALERAATELECRRSKTGNCNDPSCGHWHAETVRRLKSGAKP